MDIARPDLARQRRRRRIITAVSALTALAAVTVVVSRLKPAVPAIERNVLVFDTVKRGQMLRQVRGSGSLVPEQIQFVQAETEGRVERILALAGAEVHPDTILIELGNPDLRQATFEAEWAVKAAEAQAVRLKVQLESDRITQESTLDSLRSESMQAKLEAESDSNLAERGLIASLTAKRSRAKADDLASRIQREEQRLRISVESTQAQLAVQNADLEKARAQWKLKQRQVEALRVPAGIEGVLQQIGDKEPLQVGQRISPNATLAKIVQPTRLKAEIRIAETLAKDVVIGQAASVDTRNGIIPGRVSRVDPAVQNGTVTVDVRLEGALPRGARPDLSIEGIIELEKLDNVLHVGRPVQSQPDASVGLYRFDPAHRTARRIPVQLGRTSVTRIEVLQGLAEGDSIIVSDMSQWEQHEELRIR